jgi:hypothetical protein
MTCGHVWQWCKYDETDHQCPHCGNELVRYGKTVWNNGFRGGYVWNLSAVKIFGVGSTGEDTATLEKVFSSPLPEFKLLSAGRQHSLCNTPKRLELL